MKLPLQLYTPVRAASRHALVMPAGGCMQAWECLLLPMEQSEQQVTEEMQAGRGAAAGACPGKLFMHQMPIKGQS